MYNCFPPPPLYKDHPEEQFEQHIQHTETRIPTPMTHPPPSSFEKGCLSGVHFHEVFLSGEWDRTMPAPLKAPPIKNHVRKGGTSTCSKGSGTGVYFENREVKDVKNGGALLHPLQLIHIEDEVRDKDDENMYVSMNRTMPLSSRHKTRALPLPSLPLPTGQPLCPHPVLPSTIQVPDDEQLEEAMQRDQGSICVVHNKNSSNRQADSDNPFCDGKRTALRERLRSRDYRLSTDELMFVEAAAQLSSQANPFTPKSTALPAMQTPNSEPFIQANILSVSSRSVVHMQTPAAKLLSRASPFASTPVLAMNMQTPVSHLPFRQGPFPADTQPTPSSFFPIMNERELFFFQQRTW